jgi:deazaflavin-dependent oxidoreductase (nitroreductase family)
MLFGQEHVKRYRATDGAEGHQWRGGTVLLLTTTGRRSGDERTTPLVYAEHEGGYVVVASRGGFDHNPAWYLNLVADPEVEVQVLADRFPARARTATGAERSRLWKLASDGWPAYNDYQAKTDRELPVVVLERS